MALSDVLNNLTGARDALVTAINGKGGSVATTATIRQCAEAVTALPEGGGGEGAGILPGQIFYASFAEDTDRAESGQKLEKYNSPAFVTEDGIKCVKLENSAIYTSFPCFYGDTPFTVSFWGKAPETISNEFHIIWAGENKMYGKVHFEIVAGKFGVSDSLSFFYSENVVTGEFHHFLVTYDGAKLVAYVDGKFATQSGNFTANISLSNMFVGKTVNTVEAGPFFISTLRIFTRVLSADEISTLYDEFKSATGSGGDDGGSGESGGGDDEEIYTGDLVATVYGTPVGDITATLTCVNPDAIRQNDVVWEGKATAIIDYSFSVNTYSGRWSLNVDTDMMGDIAYGGDNFTTDNSVPWDATWTNTGGTSRTCEVSKA